MFNWRNMRKMQQKIKMTTNKSKQFILSWLLIRAWNLYEFWSSNENVTKKADSVARIQIHHFCAVKHLTLYWRGWDEFAASLPFHISPSESSIPSGDSNHRFGKTTNEMRSAYCEWSIHVVVLQQMHFMWWIWCSSMQNEGIATVVCDNIWRFPVVHSPTQFISENEFHNKIFPLL